MAGKSRKIADGTVGKPALVVGPIEAEVQLTDAMVRLHAEERMHALVIDSNTGYATGTPASRNAANARMAAADARF